MNKANARNISIVGSACTGCAACAESCVTHCIEFELDYEGFKVPKVNTEACVNCGKCLNLCPAYNAMDLRYPTKTYAATSKDKEGSLCSSSGGAFYEAAKYVITYLHGYVCGAVLDEKLCLKHLVTNSMSDIPKMQGSKYIQSDIQECYAIIKQLVQKESVVLFSGTPCQVAAIKQIVGISDYLITMDLICHGTPSSQVFKEYMLKTHPSEGYFDFSFRQKNIYNKSSFSYSYKSDNAQKHSIRVFPFQDPFYQAFIRGDNYRESCYQCQYAVNSRVGDITIGDCANYKAYELPIDKELSTICINTERGAKLWSEIEGQFDYMEADYAKETQLNAQLHKASKRTALRDDFYDDIKNLSLVKLKDKYCPRRNIKDRLTHFIMWHTTPNMRSRFKQILKGSKRRS